MLGHLITELKKKKTKTFLGMKRKACTKAQDYGYVIRIVKDRVPQGKSLKILGSE